MQDEPCVVRVWPPGADAPLASVELRSVLVLDRDCLRVNDASVSRAANAPTLEFRSSTQFKLSLPEHTAHRVALFPHTSFAALQRSLPPGRAPWLLAPAELARRGRIVCGRTVHAGLLSALAADGAGTTHYLLAVPALHWIERGERVRVPAPSILVIGEAAVDVTPDTTVVPDPAPEARAIALRIPQVEVHPEHVELLDRFHSPAGNTALWAPEQPIEVPLSLVGDLLSPLLGPAGCRVFPALVGERARLLFVYRRPNRGAGSLLSHADLQGWLDELGALLPRDAMPRAPSHRPPSRRPVAPQPEGPLTPMLEAPGAQPSSVQPSSVQPSSLQPSSAYLSSVDLPSVRPPDVHLASVHLASVPPPAAARGALPGSPLLPPGGLVSYGSFSTRNPALAEQLQLLIRDRDELGVLLLGETGTGKGRLAQEIHRRSLRASQPFVTVNCAAIEKGVMLSELFGHERGAFTGAARREGLVTSAHRGTLFLDEIGDAPMNVQLALLRLLDDGFIRPVGADRERRVDVRALAATSAPLDRWVAEGTFKRDLYYRLAHLQITLPPLRERPEDLPDVCAEILRTANSHAELSPQALGRLARYHFPGNLRELRSVLLRAVSLSESTERLEEYLFAHLPETWTPPQTEPPPMQPPPECHAQADKWWQLASADGASDDSGGDSGAGDAGGDSGTGDSGGDSGTGDSGGGELWPSNAYQARAHKRAALIVLSLQHPRDGWPAPLTHQWKLQFREGWHQSENARGRKDLMKRLGMDEKDEHLAGWLLRWLRGV